MKTKAFKKMLRAKAYDWLFPSILFYPHPFRICEYLAVTSPATLRKTDVVLDLGCGAGFQTYCIGKHVKSIVGIDPVITQYTYEEYHRVAGRMNISFRSCRLQDAQYQEATFDKIFSFCVIEHIPEYKEVLAECFRILKPGGEMHFSTDSLKTIHDPNLLERHRKDHAVIKYFDPDEMRSIMSEIGFCDVSVSYLFRGGYPARLFSNGISSRFAYKQIQAWLLVPRLYLSDLFSSKDADGVFLEIHAHKAV